MIHTSVLLQESIDGLDIKKGDIFVDGTLGNGGHSEEVLKRFGKDVSVIGIDADSDAITRTRERLTKQGFEARYLEGNFRNIDALLRYISIEKVDKILLDIGLSSNQFEESGRGFSFQKDEPLIMSFKSPLRRSAEEAEGLTAREIINEWDEENIKLILEGYGEEQFAYKIAHAITRSRVLKPIETTFELVDIIVSCTPKFYHHKKIHPATKTFQALRITVNDEIGALKEGIRKSFDLLNSSGRLAVISFHSLEDRVVKQYFNEYEKNGLGEKITKKPIIPDKKEIVENPRSRSAKLRIIKKI